MTVKPADQFSTYQDLKRYLDVINAFAASLTDTMTVDEIVWAVAKNAIAKLGFTDCVVYLLDTSKNAFVQKAAHGPKNPRATDILNPIVIQYGQGIVGSVAQTGIAEIVNDTGKDPRYVVDDAQRLSEICVPILHDGKVIGIIDSEHEASGFYNQLHMEVLTTIASITASKLIQANVFSQLQQSHHKLEETVRERTADLQQKNHELTESNENLRHFAYMVTHDLKEPLRTTTAYLQLLQRKKASQLDDEANEYIQLTTDSAARMTRLINDLTEYMRIGTLLTDTEPVDLRDVVVLAMNNLEQAIRHKNAEVVFDKLPVVNGTRNMLVSLFQNLIGNGLKYNESTQPRIEICCERISPTHFSLSVKDNGIGFDPKYADKVFEIFQRLNPAYSGSGIGLSLCKKVVELHGGQISAASIPGRGSVFSFTLAA